MKYIFILGRIPTLSLAEIVSAFRRDGIAHKVVALGDGVLVVETEKEIKDAQPFFDKLGGTIKIIEVFGEVGKAAELKEVLTADTIMSRYPHAHKEVKNIPSQKFYWGISAYFLCEAGLHTKQKIATELKSYLIGAKEVLRQREIRCRIVTPPPNKFSLDAPAVTTNNLIDKGGEIIAAVDKEKVYWGKTLAVQDFRFYGLRDYGRPERSMKVGMMPPKLAQVMINLAGAKTGETILDPFCGTGVVLQEALLMGYKAIGADKSKQTLALAKSNLEWLDEKLGQRPKRLLEEGNLKLIEVDAVNMSKSVEPKSINAIVSEGTLGPKYGRVSPSPGEMSTNFKILGSLYIAAFREFKGLFKDGGKVVITFPAYMTDRGRKTVFAPFIDKITEIGYSIVHPLDGEELPENAVISLTERKTILYSRPDQNVGREVVIFEKK